MDTTEFCAAYQEALLWAEAPDGETWSADMLSFEAVKIIEADCERFLSLVGGLIPEGEESQAGHDFWLTRKGHGAGFWDGDWDHVGEDAVKRLTDAAKGFGMQWPYVGDDGQIYLG